MTDAEQTIVVVKEGAVEDDMITKLLPAGTQLGFGTMAGLMSGYALKQGGKIGAMVLGTGFCFVQSLAYLGYVEVDWRRLERDYYHVLDANKDGKITIEDFQLMLENTTEVLKFNLPGGSGFSAGFSYGVTGSAKVALGATMAYGGLTSVALGGVPTDLFSAKGLERIANSSVESIKSSLPTMVNIPERDSAVILDRALKGRSLEDLRVLEYEIKNDVGISAELMGINMKTLSKDEVLSHIEETKKAIKSQ